LIVAGHCGSCWAFSAITALEFSKCKKTGVAVSLRYIGLAMILLYNMSLANTVVYYIHSEQMLIDCDNSNSGCGGGDYTRAWQYAYDKGGAMTSTSYPYVSGAINQTVGPLKFKFNIMLIMENSVNFRAYRASSTAPQLLST
jgi:cathepsin L